ncbi:UNVERIFIED_ORG: hypothetical protein HNP28_002049 [Comamonas terrigena]
MVGGLSGKNAKETLNFKGPAAIKTGAAMASMRYMWVSAIDSSALQIKVKFGVFSHPEGSACTPIDQLHNFQEMTVLTSKASQIAVLDQLSYIDAIQ